MEKEFSGKNCKTQKFKKIKENVLFVMNLKFVKNKKLYESILKKQIYGLENKVLHLN